MAVLGFSRILPEWKRGVFLDNKNFSGKKKAVALGIFDGVHLGHRAVFERAKSFEDMGMETAVFTFDTGSITVKHGESYRYIAPDDIKTQMINNAGIKHIYRADFSEMRSLSAEDFVLNVLKEKMNAGAVICGRDFRFGKDAACGTDELIRFGKKYGFEVSIVEPVIIDGEIVSSSAVKNFLINGDIKKANIFLGYDYSIDQTVVHGNHIGRTIDFSTINQHFLPQQIIPGYGVYASFSVIDGKKYLSVTNIGVKPTVTSENVPLAETHIINYKGDLYKRRIQVSLFEYIRSEHHFQSLYELKKQIKKDTEAVKALGGI